MGQRAAMDDFLGELHEALDGVLADTGSYRAPVSATWVPSRVFMNYGSEVRGEFGQIIGHRIEADFLTADVDPAVKGTLKVEGVDYVLTDKLYERDGVARWVVRNA